MLGEGPGKLRHKCSFGHLDGRVKILFKCPEDAGESRDVIHIHVGT